MRQRLEIKVTGRVQGVFFRMAAKEQALALRLDGIVANSADDGVVIAVEGEPAVLERFVEWCRRGPENATVRSVDVRSAAPVGLKGFIAR